MDELTATRGNSAGPSVDADAAPPKLNINAAVTMNMAACRISALLENTETRMLTTYSLVESDFPWEGIDK
jgi:hypothetical protein